MKTFVFVHGTGVREPAYSASFMLVQEKLNTTFGPLNVRTELCYWGDRHGCTLFLGGASIPLGDTSKGVGSPDQGDDAYDRAIWATLYENPEAELALLAMAGTSEKLIPGHESAGDLLADQFRALTLPGGAATPLREAGIIDYFEPAKRAVAASRTFRKAMATAAPPFTAYRYALARAVIAVCVQMSWERGSLSPGEMLLDGAQRDLIVEELVATLGGKEAALGGTGAWIGNIVAGMGTRWFTRRRAELSHQAAPFGADVIAYQARPGPIRSFIRQKVEATIAARNARGEKGDVYILAHSLGGIAAFEMLVEAPIAGVAGLITIGSQIPLLYELDALASLPLPKDDEGRPTGGAEPLPSHLSGRWLNIYDPHDFLAYRAGEIFPEAQDIEVRSRQPFPQSHSAYWANGAVWEAVADFAA